MHWERALDEWNKSVPADVDQQDVSRAQKKLESTKVKLAQQRSRTVLVLVIGPSGGEVI